MALPLNTPALTCAHTHHALAWRQQVWGMGRNKHNGRIQELDPAVHVLRSSVALPLTAILAAPGGTTTADPGDGLGLGPILGRSDSTVLLCPLTFGKWPFGDPNLRRAAPMHFCRHHPFP